VLAHGAAQVGLVGEAEIGGEHAEVAFAVLQPVERLPDPHAVAVPRQGHAQLAGKSATQPVRRDAQ